MSGRLLEVSGLSVSYGRIEAVQDVSLVVPAGQIVTVIGTNGAGKSSLLNAIMGLQPARGRVRFDGVVLDRLPLEDRVAHKISLVPERRELFATMSVEDNLRLGAYRLTSAVQGRSDMASVFQLFPRLQERRGQMAGTLSGGERQMVAMARALMGRPRLLMLDEPSLGLAPLIVREVFRIIAELAKTGVAILLVEQNARAALRIAQTGYVMELGRVLRSAPAADLLADPSMVAFYLGGAAEMRGRAPITT
jgi:branched-chain amino acid transport system ATP-binding protein